MPVTITNTLVSVADGAGAPVNIASGGVATVTPGNILTFALQSKSLVQSWTLQFICPAYPSLNGRIYNWYQGQANQLLVPLPGESVSSTDPARGIQWVSSVTDGASVASSLGFIAASLGVPANSQPTTILSGSAALAATDTWVLFVAGPFTLTAPAVPIPGQLYEMTHTGGGSLTGAGQVTLASGAAYTITDPQNPTGTPQSSVKFLTDAITYRFRLDGLGVFRCVN
jgi:hypothetical protein